MSVTHNAVVLVGSQVAKSKIFTTGMVPGCGHGVVNEWTNFCSECGKRAWKEDIVPIIGYEGDKDYSNGYSTLGGLPVFFASHDDCIWVAGYSEKVSNEDAYPVALLSINHVVARQLVYRVLSPLGLWENNTFGTWLIML